MMNDESGAAFVIATSSAGSPKSRRCSSPPHQRTVNDGTTCRLAASAKLNADRDGQENRFEFLAGISPIDPTARFLLSPTPVPNQPGPMNLVINPSFTDRTYTVMTSPTLGTSAVWTPLIGFTFSDNGLTRTITDNSAGGERKFYRVDITKPRV